MFNTKQFLTIKFFFFKMAMQLNIYTKAWLRQNYNGTEVQHIADNLCGQAARTLMQLLTKTTVHYVTDSTKRHHSDQLKKILNNREFIHVLGGNSILLFITTVGFV